MRVQLTRLTGVITLLDKEDTIYKNSVGVPQIVVEADLNSGESIYITYGTKDAVTGTFTADTRFSPLVMLDDGEAEYYSPIPSDILEEAGTWAFSLAIKTPILVSGVTRYKQSTSTVYEFEINDSLSSAEYESIEQTNVDILQGGIEENAGDIAALGGRMDTAEADIEELQTHVGTAEGNIESLDGRITELEEDITNINTDTQTRVDNAVSTHNTATGRHSTQFAGKVDKVTGSSLVPDTAKLSYDSHLSNTSNPHSVTKTQVGLGNCDNTSDANKPVSTAGQTALDFKVDKEGAVTGIKGNAEETYRTGNVNITAANIGTLTESEILALHENIPRAITFTDTAELTAWLAAEFEREDDILPTSRLIGDIFYTLADDEPDYWVSSLPLATIANLSEFKPDINLQDYIKSVNGLTPDENGAITIPEAVPTGEGQTDGLLTHEDKAKLNANTAAFTYELKTSYDAAQANVLESVSMAGTPLTITSKGVNIPLAVATGEGETNGVMSPAQVAKLSGIAENANNYSLPTMSADVAGGAKLGTGLSIADGVLNATATASGTSINVEIAEGF